MNITINNNEIEIEADTGNKQWFASINGKHEKYNWDREFEM